MQKTIIALVVCLITLPLFSQSGREQRHEKIKALKVALITEKLNLSASEAEKFWPIYNAFEEQQEQLRKSTFDKRENLDFETLSENEAEVLLDKMVASGKERYDLYSKYIKDLKKVIPAKKIILLKKVEEEFKRKMFKEFRERRQKTQRNKP